MQKFTKASMKYRSTSHSKHVIRKLILCLFGVSLSIFASNAIKPLMASAGTQDYGGFIGTYGPHYYDGSYDWFETINSQVSNNCLGIGFVLVHDDAYLRYAVASSAQGLTWGNIGYYTASNGCIWGSADAPSGWDIEANTVMANGQKIATNWFAYAEQWTGAGHVNNAPDPSHCYWSSNASFDLMWATYNSGYFFTKSDCDAYYSVNGYYPIGFDQDTWDNSASDASVDNTAPYVTSNAQISNYNYMGTFPWFTANRNLGVSGSLGEGVNGIGSGIEVVDIKGFIGSNNIFKIGQHYSGVGLSDTSIDSNILSNEGFAFVSGSTTKALNYTSCVVAKPGANFIATAIKQDAQTNTYHNNYSDATENDLFGVDSTPPKESVGTITAPTATAVIPITVTDYQTNYESSDTTGSGVNTVKIAKGAYTTSNFPASGKVLYSYKNFTDSVSVTDTENVSDLNAVYTIYMEDNVGNVSTKQETLIAPAPTMSVSFNPGSKSWTNATSVVVKSVASDSSASTISSYTVSLYNISGVLQKSWNVNSTSSSVTIPLGNGSAYTASGVYKITATAMSTQYTYDTATATSGSFYIDTISPQISSNPTASNNWYNSLNVTLAATDTGGSGLSTSQYRISSDNGTSWGSWNSLTNGSGTVTLPEGKCLIGTSASDIAGNTTNTNFGPYYVDKTAPTVSYSLNSSGWTHAAKEIITVADPIFNGVSSGVATASYAISTDGGNTFGISTVFTTSASFSLPQGIIVIKTVVKDNAGNTVTVLSGKIYEDNTAPTISFNPNGSSWTNSVSTAISVSDTGGSGPAGGSWYILNTATNTKSASTVFTGATTTVDIPEGNNVVCVTATDVAGNSASSQSKSFAVDKTKPTASFSPNSASWTNSAAITISTSDPTSNGVTSGVASQAYRVSTDAGTTYGSWNTFTKTSSIALPEGKDYIQVTVTDTAGNTNLVTSGQYQIDNTAPTMVVTSNAPLLTGSAQGTTSWINTPITVTFSPQDCGATQSGVKEYDYAIDWSADGTAWSVYKDYSRNSSGAIEYATTPTSTITLANEGFYRIRYWVVDNAGNEFGTDVSASSHSTVATLYYAKQEETAPTTAFISTTPTSTWTNTTNTVTIIPQDVKSKNGAAPSGVKTYSFSVSKSTDNSTWQQCYTSGSIDCTTLPQSTYAITTDGYYKITVHTTDYAGNSASTDSGIYEVDKTPPVVPTLTLNHYNWTTTNLTASIATSDALSGIKLIQYSVNGGVWQDYTGPVTLTQSGWYSISARAYDYAGNVVYSADGSGGIDTPPTISIVNQADWCPNNSPDIFSATAKYIPSSDTQVQFGTAGITTDSQAISHAMFTGITVHCKVTDPDANQILNGYVTLHGAVSGTTTTFPLKFGTINGSTTAATSGTTDAYAFISSNVFNSTDTYTLTASVSDYGTDGLGVLHTVSCSGGTLRTDNIGPGSPAVSFSDNTLTLSNLSDNLTRVFTVAYKSRVTNLTDWTNTKVITVGKENAAGPIRIQFPQTGQLEISAVISDVNGNQTTIDTTQISSGSTIPADAQTSWQSNNYIITQNGTPDGNVSTQLFNFLD